MKLQLRRAVTKLTVATESGRGYDRDKFAALNRSLGRAKRSVPPTWRDSLA